MQFKIWIRALSEFLAVAFHGQLQCISDLSVDVTNWTIRKIKTSEIKIQETRNLELQGAIFFINHS